MKLKNIISSAITFLLCVFLFSSCEEKEKVWTELPPVTQTGANTIGCLVDGQLWAIGKIPGYTLTPAMHAEYSIYKKDTSVLHFYAENKDRNGIGFRIFNPQIGENNIYYVGGGFRTINKTCDDLIGLNIKGLVITKLDIQNRILSGNFNIELNCVNDSTKKVNLTDGRFDMYLYVNK